ncbi:MAG: hypothetical protein JWL76_165 [Thermoleophilia bacterium]|nr:hypothetical protein [Thermoleophilia bacterium]
MWTIGDEEPAEQPAVATRPDCPGCGEADEHGDDFCHECGHSFQHLGREDSDATSHALGEECPMCPNGELVVLSYGRTQCDTCGYTARDEG